MADYDLFQKIVKALALGEGANARDLLAQMDDQDQHEYVIYVGASFAELAGQLFDQDHSIVAIKEFVDEMAHAYRSTNPPFKPMAMEALIRALFYDDQSIDEVSADDQFRLQMMALRMIVHKSPEIYAQLDLHLTESRTTAARWLSES